MGSTALGYNSQLRLCLFTQQVINVTSVFPPSTLFDPLIQEPIISILPSKGLGVLRLCSKHHCAVSERALLLPGSNCCNAGMTFLPGNLLHILCQLLVAWPRAWRMQGVKNLLLNNFPLGAYLFYTKVALHHQNHTSIPPRNSAGTFLSDSTDESKSSTHPTNQLKSSPHGILSYFLPGSEVLCSLPNYLFGDDPLHGTSEDQGASG